MILRINFLQEKVNKAAIVNKNNRTVFFILSYDKYLSNIILYTENIDEYNLFLVMFFYPQTPKFPSDESFKAQKKRHLIKVVSFLS